MAIQLPKYRRQVGAASGAGATQMVDPNAAIAPTRAMGKALDATTNMGMKVAGIVGEKRAEKRETQLKAANALTKFNAGVKKLKDEGDIAGYKKDKQLYAELLEVQKNEAKLKGTSPEQMYDDVIEPSLSKFKDGMSEKGYSEEVMGFIESDWAHESGMYQVKQTNDILLDTIIGSNLKKVDYATMVAESGDAEGANEILDGLSATAKPEQIDRWREEVSVAGEQAEKERERSAEKARNSTLTADTMNDPVGTLEKINTQRSGGEQFYDVEPTALKAAKSEATAEIAKRQAKAADTLYDKDNDYRKLPVQSKIDILNEMRDSGAISSKTYKKEYEDAVEPNTVDITPQNNVDWVNATAEIRKAGQDPVKQAQVLDRIGAMGFPQNMKTDLYSFSKDVLDPMSSYNKGRAGFAFDQIENSFGNVLVDEFKWKGFFGDKEGKTSFEESREAIVGKAQYEAETIMNEWLRTDGAEAGPNEIQRKVNDVMIGINDKYNLKNYEELLDTITDTPDADATIEVEDDIANEWLDAQRANR